METTFWGIDDTKSLFLGKNLYLKSIGITKPTLTFQSKISIYFLKVQVVMGPTLFSHKTIMGITSLTLRNTKGLSSEWKKQPTLSLKVTTKNSFPNTKWSMRPILLVTPSSPTLVFLDSIQHFPHCGKVFLKVLPIDEPFVWLPFKA